MPIYLVFYTSRLKPYNHREGELEVLLGPIVLDNNNAQEERYKVNLVLAKRRRGLQV